MTSAGVPVLERAARAHGDEPVDHRQQGGDDVLDPDDRDTLGPQSLMVPTRSATSASVRPPAISSSSSRRGPVARARASSRRLRSRSGSVPAGHVGPIEQPGRAPAPRRPSRSDRGTRPSRADDRRTSRRAARSRRPSCRRTAAGSGTSARCRAWPAGGPGTSRDVPAVQPDPTRIGRRSPPMRLRTLVLPAPLGPTMPSVSPRSRPGATGRRRRRRCRTPCETASSSSSGRHAAPRPHGSRQPPGSAASCPRPGSRDGPCCSR